MICSGRAELIAFSVPRWRACQQPDYLKRARKAKRGFKSRENKKKLLPAVTKIYLTKYNQEKYFLVFFMVKNLLSPK